MENEFGEVINVDEISPQAEFDVVPPGTYKVLISKAEIKDTKEAGGKYLKLEHEVLDGDYAGRKIFNNINFRNSNEKTVKIGKAMLSQLSKACGITGELQFAAQFQNIPIEVIVDCKRDDTYGNQNIIKKYVYQDDSGGTPKSVTVSNTGAVKKAEPSKATAQGVVHSSTAPWAKKPE